MKSLSVKEYLSLKMPTEEAPVSDHGRILLALDALGYEHVTILFLPDRYRSVS